MTTAIISLSGGMDSATLLGYVKANIQNVTACHFQYGSKHNEYEEKAVQELCLHYKTRLLVFDLREIFGNIKSDLLLTGGEIPEGHHEDESMSKTVVPGRNLIFASILLEVYSRRLQIQERIGQQVTNALDKLLLPRGSACILEAQHFCMTSRGVEKQHSKMITSSLTGVFRNQEVRTELLSLISN